MLDKILMILIGILGLLPIVMVIIKGIIINQMMELFLTFIGGIVFGVGGLILIILWGIWSYGDE